MFGTYVAGISFADDVAHLSVFKARKNSVKLKFLAEYPRNGPGDLWFLDGLLAGKEKILRKVSRAAIAVDGAASFVHCFPSDSSLNAQEEQDQISWELSNFIPMFNADEYTREKHLLQTHAHRQYSHLLIVAYKKTFLERARGALREKEIDLANSGTNHFGAQHALLINNPEIKTKAVALVHVMKNRIEVGVINRGRLVHYSSASFTSAERALEALRPAIDSFPVSEIYFHGSEVTKELLAEAKAGFSSSIIALNPFKDLDVASSFREFDSYAGKEHRFAAAVGSALHDR
jgi:hypothetical protein